MISCLTLLISRRRCGLVYFTYAGRCKAGVAISYVMLWAGSRYHAAVLGSNDPSLRLGDEIVVPRDHFRIGVSFRPTGA